MFPHKFHPVLQCLKTVVSPQSRKYYFSKLYQVLKLIIIKLNNNRNGQSHLYFVGSQLQHLYVAMVTID